MGAGAGYNNFFKVIFNVTGSVFFILQTPNGIFKDAKIISRHGTLALLSFQVFRNLPKLVTS